MQPGCGGEKQSGLLFRGGGQKTRDVRRADTTGDKTLDGRRLDEKTVEKSLQKTRK